MTNLDNRIQNPDQLLTQDVDKLCEGIVELYSNLSKASTTPFSNEKRYFSRFSTSCSISTELERR